MNMMWNEGITKSFPIPVQSDDHLIPREPRGLTDDQVIIIRWHSVLENHVVWVVDLIPASAAAAAMVVELSEEQQRKP